MKADFHKRLVALKTADAISAIKGVPISADAKFLSEKWVRGELTGEQMKVPSRFMRKIVCRLRLSEVNRQ